MTGEPRSATIVAEEETLLLALTRETMSQLLHNNAAVAKRLSESLAEREAYNKAAGARCVEDAASGPAIERMKRNAEVASVEIFDRIKRFFRLA